MRRFERVGVELIKSKKDRIHFPKVVDLSTSPLIAIFSMGRSVIRLMASAKPAKIKTKV
jgi:hypothetical protein